MTDCGGFQRPRTERRSYYHCRLRLRRYCAPGPANGSPWVFPGTGTSGHTIEPKRGWLRVKQRTQLLRLVAAVAEQSGWGEGEIRTYTERALSNCAESIEALREELKRRGVNSDQYMLGDLRFHDLRRTLGSWQA